MDNNGVKEKAADRKDRWRRVLDEAIEAYSHGAACFYEWAGEACDLKEAGFRSFIKRYVEKHNSGRTECRIFSLDFVAEEIMHLSRHCAPDKIIEIDGKRVNLTDIAYEAAEAYNKTGCRKPIAVIADENYPKIDGFAFEKVMEFEISKFAPTIVLGLNQGYIPEEMFYVVDFRKSFG